MWWDHSSFSAAVDIALAMSQTVCFLLAEVQAIIISPRFCSSIHRISQLCEQGCFASVILTYQCCNGTAFFLDISYVLFVLVFVEVLSSLHLLCLFFVMYCFENSMWNMESKWEIYESKYLEIHYLNKKSGLKSRLILLSKSCLSASVDLSRIYLLP